MQTGNVGGVAITVQVPLWWVTVRGSVSLIPAASKRHAELLMLGNQIARGVNPATVQPKARLANAKDVERMASWAEGGDEEAQRIMDLCAGYREVSPEPAVEVCEQIELFAS